VLAHISWRNLLEGHVYIAYKPDFFQFWWFWSVIENAALMPAMQAKEQ
jgi:hypothetical protein